jgi:hypothetical protein
MSAINTFALQNFLCILHTNCLCVFAEETMHAHQEPVVTARWSLVTAQDGSQRLVRHWFRNERPDLAAYTGKTR